MDSLTQFALGATVSALCLGRTLGPRKAALLGGTLGTIPDLDVFLPFDDPVDSFVLHRGWTHSLFTHALAAPLIGEVLVRLISVLKDHRIKVWLTVFLCFSTHAIIDAMTVYGTRLFWPVYPDPVGVGSIFIIDPIYTVPLLVVVIWSLLRKHWTPRLQKAIATTLVLTSVYMGIGVALQANAESRARAIFADAGIEADRVFAIAAPFNTVLWKVIGLEDDRYHNLYLSLFDDDANARVYSHQRHPELVTCLSDVDAFKKLRWFSRGYYKAEVENGRIVISDLRMGLTPSYVFRFAIAEYVGGRASPIEPESSSNRMDSFDEDIDWLGQRLVGEPAERKAEAPALTPKTRTQLASC